MRALALATAMLSTGAAIAVAVPAAASKPEPAGSRIHSGLHGHVEKGPLTPVCSVGVPCYGPAKGALIVFVRRGHVVARTRSDSTAAYRITLRPGRYVLRSRIGFGVVDPRVVIVQRGRFAQVDLMLDTGIR